MNEQQAVATRQTVGVDDLGGLMKMAETLISSGFLPLTIKTPAQAVAIMITGRELQIPTMQALRQINVIQGKPTMAVELMLALAYQRIPGFKCIPVETTDKVATFDFFRPGMAANYRHSFSMQDAMGLGLVGKDNWKKQPATMLRWRCISAGLRLIAPDAIAGLYAPEELDPNLRLDTNGSPDIAATREAAAPSCAAVDMLAKKKAAAPAPEPTKVATPLPAVEPPAANPEEAHEPPPSADQIITGVVEEVEEKPGINKRTGKPFTKFGVKVAGVWYGTFDVKLADYAQMAKQDGLPVELAWEQSGKFKNLVAIKIVNDDLPYDDAPVQTELPGTK